MAVGYKGYGTPEQVKRRREIADALMANVLQGGRSPQTIGDALNQGLGDIGAALAVRGNRKSAEKMEREGRESARGTNREAIARALSGLSGGQSRSPVSPTRQERGGAVQPSSAPAQGGLPPGLMNAVYQVESGGNFDAVSPKGAVGMGQIMPPTARDPGYGVPNIFETARQLGREVPDESDATMQKLLRDPEVNKAFSTNYMTAMHREQGGDIDATLAAYNAGPGAVQRHGGVPPYAETQNYVQNVQAQAPAATMTDAAPQTGQPAPQQSPQQPAAQPDMEYIEGLMSVLENPWSSEADKAMAQMVLEQHMERMQPPEPMSEYQRRQLELQQQGLGLDQRQFGFEQEKFGAEHGLDRRQFEAGQKMDQEKLALEREKARSTGDLTEYDRYVDQEKAAGRQPLGFLEYQSALKTAGKPETTINMEGDSAWTKESAKLFAKRYDDLTTQADSAGQMLGLLDMAEQGLNTGIRTGAMGGSEHAIRQLGQAMGIGDADKVAGGELLKAVTNRMALMMRSPDSGMGMPGAVSDRDLQFLSEAQVGIDRSPEGNRRMLEAFRKLEQRKIEIARLADQYIQQKGRLDVGFNEAVKEYAKANPLFPPPDVVDETADDDIDELLKKYQ